jgi:N-acetylglucosamine malate deacetylase 2
MNVLAFFAHPDDETILAGGTLALLAQSGAQVHYLCATRGEGGELGEPPQSTRSDLGAVREQELVCAVQVLGGRSLTFLGYRDPEIGEGGEVHPYSQELTLVAGQLAASIRQFQADAVLAHGSNGEYGHPAHVFSHQAALVAVKSLAEEGPAPVLYTVSASYAGHPYPRLANADDPAHLVVDITPVLEKKVSAALCHRTQAALFVRWASQEAGRQLRIQEVILPVESLHRAFPAAEEKPADALAACLAAFCQPPGPGGRGG